MTQTIIARSNELSLDELFANLAANDNVDAVALFGSLPNHMTNSVSDYDLLIMVHDPPVRIFQLQTYIHEIMADVAFVETDVADRVLALENPVPVTSNEGFLIGWLEYAQIVFDKTSRFTQIQQKLATNNWRVAATDSDTYADWFWLNFDLRQMKRMVQSPDPVYQLTVDIHLMTNLSQLWRVYYRFRNLHWRGVKEAARYLSAHDPSYLSLYRACLSEPDCLHKLMLFERLVCLSLAPVADLWSEGATAVYLKNPLEHPDHVAEALEFWQEIVAGKSTR